MNLYDFFQNAPQLLIVFGSVYCVLGFFRLKRLLRAPFFLMVLGMVFIPMGYILPAFAIYELVSQVFIVLRKFNLVKL